MAYKLLKPFGNCDDAPCFEEEKVKYIEAIDALSAAGGGDLPESQTVALFNAATEWMWRQGVLKVGGCASWCTLTQKKVLTG